MIHPLISPARAWVCGALLGVLLACPNAPAQQRLQAMPRYERYQRLAKAVPGSVKSGALTVVWEDSGRAFTYTRDGRSYRYDTATLKSAQIPAPAKPKREGPRPERPERGRQQSAAASPDGAYKAFHRERNLWLRDIRGSNEVALTTDGSDKTRVKYGIANWVYGEELYQTTAIWWSPDSRKVAFYRFDESAVRDYYLTLDETQIQNRMDVEPYMKVGTPNPVAGLLIYDLDTRKTTTVDVRDGQPFSNESIGHYVYGVSWSSNSHELLFHRTNRRQNRMEFCAATPGDGRCRVVVAEEWPASWTENLPPFQFLKDGRRFVWASERTGWRNYYLCSLDGAPPLALTRNPFEGGVIVRVDEPGNRFYYMAHSGDNPLKLQLHQASLDGLQQKRLTDPAFHHTASISPDGRFIVDVAQTHDTPPVTRLLDGAGRPLAELARSDESAFKALGLKRVELFTFKAADGVTDLYGTLHFPSDFVPYLKYPMLVSVYAGPATVGARETFTLPNTLTELGFLVATFDSRSASGRGKQFLDAIYAKLGIAEVDDQAAGVRFLSQRRYVHPRRVGMFGTSYGGSVSATSILRYPDVFQAACACSAVTDYRNYDSIYAERYLGLPQDNKAAFDAARVMTYATNLHGSLMLFYGTADNNVHPANTLQLIQSLQRAGKSFEVQVGPDMGHTSVNRERMMEFFIENLVRRTPPKYKPAKPARAAVPKP